MQSLLDENMLNLLIMNIKSTIVPTIVATKKSKNIREKLLLMEKDLKEINDLKKIEKTNVLKMESISIEDANNSNSNALATTHVCVEYEKECSAQKGDINIALSVLKTADEFLNGIRKNLLISFSSEKDKTENIKKTLDDALIIITEDLRDLKTLIKDSELSISNILQYSKYISETSMYISAHKSFIPRITQNIEEQNIRLKFQNTFNDRVLAITGNY